MVRVNCRYVSHGKVVRWVCGFSMNYISWNVRRLGRPEKKRAMKKLFKIGNFSFMDIQETKLKQLNNRVTIQLWLREWNQMENSGGLISFWKSNFFSVESKRVFSRYVLLIGTMLELNFRCGFGIAYA